MLLLVSIVLSVLVSVGGSIVAFIKLEIAKIFIDVVDGTAVEGTSLVDVIVVIVYVVSFFFSFVVDNSSGELVNRRVGHDCKFVVNKPVDKLSSFLFILLAKVVLLEAEMNE